MGKKAIGARLASAPKEESREPTSCPPGRVRPRLSAARSGRPPDSPPSLAGGPSPSPDTRRPALKAGPARGLRRAAAGLAFLPLLVLTLLAGVAPVEAQTTFVSNTGETVSFGSDDAFQAQDFTTGANTTGNTGITLSEVQVRLGPLSSGESTSVTIRENNASNQPGDLVATLTNPATP